MATRHDSDYDVVSKHAKYIEGLLVDRYGATGNSLHKKISSVEHGLPAATVKRLRYIASVRNKLLHDRACDHLDDRPGFVEACTIVERDLVRRAIRVTPPVQQAPRTRDRGAARGVLGAVGVSALVGGVALLIRRLRDEGYF